MNCSSNSRRNLHQRAIPARVSWLPCFDGRCDGVSTAGLVGGAFHCNPVATTLDLFQLDQPRVPLSDDAAVVVYRVTAARGAPVHRL